MKVLWWGLTRRLFLKWYGHSRRLKSRQRNSRSQPALAGFAIFVAVGFAAVQNPKSHREEREDREENRIFRVSFAVFATFAVKT
jgi:hypothetical protein